MPVTRHQRLPAIVMILIGACAPARAAPVPDQERIPLDLRRTTLIVQDMEASLHFYRDALGLRVAYDHVIRTPRDAASDDIALRSLRLVLLQANDDFVGMIGLIQYLKPHKTARSTPTEPFSIGSMVFVFNTADLARRFEAARRVPNVRVVEEPAQTTYPAYQGSGVIPVMVSTLQDPDGYVVELNQLLVDKPR